MNAFETIQEFSKMLTNVDAWIVKASEHAKAKSFDTSVFVASRLAPDQYSFDRQVQGACDQAKYLAAYLSGKEPPSHPDTEKTFDELRTRIKTVQTYLATFKEADFKGAEDRKVKPRWLEGKWLRANDFLAQVAIPNFFFHVTTGYAILRHNGVPLGKQDFIGALPVQS
jgi:hypothetical protein